MAELKRVGTFRVSSGVELLGEEVLEALARDVEFLDMRYDRHTGFTTYRAIHPSFDEVEDSPFVPRYEFVISMVTGHPVVTWHAVKSGVPRTKEQALQALDKALRAIIAECEKTHSGQERAFTALSHIHQMARIGLAS